MQKRLLNWSYKTPLLRVFLLEASFEATEAKIEATEAKIEATETKIEATEAKIETTEATKTLLL